MEPRYDDVFSRWICPLAGVVGACEMHVFIQDNWVLR